MAANLGQTFLGASAMVPNLAQELAAGNFGENRESFHDYIYSKLVLGDEKGTNPTISSPSTPVFPNTNLASSYPNSLPSVSGLYSQGSSSSNHNVALDGGSNDVSSASAASKTFIVPLVTKAPKSGTSKKKVSQEQHDVIPQVGSESGDDLTKFKKKSHHKKKEKNNVCDVCGRGFAEKYTLNRHMLTHTHIKPYSCTKCNMSFSRSDGLAKHMAAGHRRIDAHHCDICGGTFNSEVSFEQHRREYGNTLPFVCNLCMLAFSQCCHLNYHMKSHSLSKMNDSFVADSLNDKNNAIDVSELIPDDFSPPKKDVKNSFSGFNFSQTRMEDSHMERRNEAPSLGLLDPNIVVKPEIEDYSTCHASHKISTRTSSSIDSSSFNTLNNFIPMTSSSSSLASHDVPDSQANKSESNLTSSIDGLAPSYLPDTSGSLSSPSSSEAASISELEMKKYLDIKIPNPRFMDSSLLQGAGASEDGLFRCGICGKGFTRKYHMQRHVKLHIRGPVPKAHLLDWTRRPYACGVCKMGFTRQHHLTRHMLIHTGERPHSCHVCGKAFRRFTNLTLHVRTVHGAERPFKCQICGRGFPRLYSLQRHLKLHAKNAAELNSGSNDQLYRDFKAVGIVNSEGSKSLSFSSFNSGSLQQSPGHSRESVSSDNSDGSEQFKHVSSVHKDSVEHIDPGTNGSQATYRDRYALMQEGSRDGFHSQSDLHDCKDQNVSSLSSQADERLGQSDLKHQVMSPPDADIRVKNNRIADSNTDRVKQKSIQIQSPHKFIHPPRPNSEPMSGHIQLQSRNATDFNQQTSLQNTNNERFVSVNSIANQNIRELLRTADISVSRNFTELDTRETNKYPLIQRVGTADGFVLHPQRIQSPHPLMNSLERPGSRSIMNQPSDTYHQPQTAYVQQPSPLMTQQRANIDLSVTRTTISPVGVIDSGAYSHNHHVDRGNLSVINDPPAYSNNSNLSSIRFPGTVHAIYQQQISDITHLDNRPNPSASPMPINSHNSNIQY